MLPQHGRKLRSAMRQLEHRIDEARSIQDRGLPSDPSPLDICE
jgi:hypothetical protein